MGENAACDDEAPLRPRQRGCLTNTDPETTDGWTCRSRTGLANGAGSYLAL
jgi:hypothetical protein